MKVYLLITLIIVLLSSVVSPSLMDGLVMYASFNRDSTINFKFDELTILNRTLSVKDIALIYYNYSDVVCVRGDYYYLMSINETSGTWKVYDNVCIN